MDEIMRHRRAVLMLMLAAVLWSTSGVLIKITDWSPMAILSGRSAVAALLFLAARVGATPLEGLLPSPMEWAPLKLAGAVERYDPES